MVRGSPCGREKAPTAGGVAEPTPQKQIISHRREEAKAMRIAPDATGGGCPMLESRRTRGRGAQECTAWGGDPP